MSDTPSTGTTSQPHDPNQITVGLSNIISDQYIARIRYPLFVKQTPEQEVDFLRALNMHPAITAAQPGQDDAGYLYIALKPGIDEAEAQGIIQQAIGDASNTAGQTPPSSYRYVSGKDILSPPDHVQQETQGWWGKMVSRFSRQMDHWMGGEGKFDAWRDQQLPPLVGNLYLTGTLALLGSTVWRQIQTWREDKTGNDRAVEALGYLMSSLFIAGNMVFRVGKPVDWGNLGAELSTTFETVNQQLADNGLAPLTEAEVGKLKTEMAKRYEQFQQTLGQNAQEANGALIAAALAVMGVQSAVSGKGIDKEMAIASTVGLASVGVQTFVPQSNGYNPILDRFPKVKQAVQWVHERLPGPLKNITEAALNWTSNNRPMVIAGLSQISNLYILFSAIRSNDWFKGLTSLAFTAATFAQGLMREMPNDDLYNFAAASFVKHKLETPPAEGVNDTFYADYQLARQEGRGDAYVQQTFDMLAAKAQAQRIIFDPGQFAEFANQPTGDNAAHRKQQGKMSRYFQAMTDMLTAKQVPETQEQTVQQQVTLTANSQQPAAASPQPQQIAEQHVTQALLNMAANTSPNAAKGTWLQGLVAAAQDEQKAKQAQPAQTPS